MKIRRKLRQSKAHMIPWVISLVFVALVIAAYGAVRGAIAIGEAWCEDLPSVTDVDAFKYTEATTIYASDGETVLAELYLKNQIPVELEDISDLVLLGTVATEDERFYSHSGIDLFGIARALVNNLLGGSLQGASTITQQLIRNTILSDEANDATIERKIREAELALEMEHTYTKDEILVMYLNVINYANGCYGIQAASHYYFSKDVKDLTLAEAATLIGIPQGPTYNDPVAYPENCITRRNHVLLCMYTNKIITKDEYEAARNEPLVLNISDTNSEGILLYPYFTSYVRQCLLEELSYAEVFTGGFEVISTLDVTMQEYAEEAVQTVYSSMSTKDSDVILVMTSVDPNTGYIKAMIGGKDYSTSQFNIATSESGRQVGSSFKAFTLATAIEQGIDPNTQIDCTDRFIYYDPDTNAKWEVHNFDNYEYGIRSIASAIRVSSNTGFARLITDEDAINPTQVLEMAARLGVSGTVSNGFSAVPAITLGVGQSNTTKMAAAYGCFATGGMKYETTCIDLVRNNKGETIIDNSGQLGTRVLSEEVSYAVTKVLQDVIKSGTAKGYSLANGQVSAGKTGTSESMRDLWMVGYTPQLSTAVWAGVDPERALTEANWCKRVWKLFMDNALSAYEVQNFKTAADPVYDSYFNTKQENVQEMLVDRLIEESMEAGYDEFGVILRSQKYTVVEQYDDEVAPSDLIKIDYNPTTKLFTVYMSKGPEDGSLHYAYCINHTLTTAKYILKYTGFKNIIVEYIYTNDDDDEGNVVDQSTYYSDQPTPVYDEEGNLEYTVPAGTITIYVSKGVDPDAEEDEDE